MRTLLVFLSLVISGTLISQKWYIDQYEDMQLWGKISVNDLQKAPYSQWYYPNQEDYHPMMNEEVSKAMADVNVVIYLGTWCSDSQEWVPKFIKLWDALDLSQNRLQIVGVSNLPDKYKQAPDRSEVNYNIERVPTFIFFRGEEEIGRIVEYPVGTLDEDVKSIALRNMTINF